MNRSQEWHEFHSLEVQRDVIEFVKASDSYKVLNPADIISTSVLAVLADIAASARVIAIQLGDICEELHGDEDSFDFDPEALRKFVIWANTHDEESEGVVL